MGPVSLAAKELYNQRYELDHEPISTLSKTKEAALEFFKTTVFVLTTPLLTPVFIVSPKELTNFAIGFESVTITKIYIFVFKFFKGTSKLPPELLNYNIQNNNLKLVKLLLEEGVQINDATQNHLTNAILYNNQRLALLLLSYGIDKPNNDSWQYNLPLAEVIKNACESQDLSYLKVMCQVKSLFQFSYSPSNQTYLLRNFFSFLDKSNYLDLPNPKRTEILSLIFNAGLKTDFLNSSEPLNHALKADNFDAFKLLLLNGVNPKLEPSFCSLQKSTTTSVIDEALNTGDMRYLKEIAKNKDNFEQIPAFFGKLSNQTFEFLYTSVKTTVRISTVLSEILKSGIDPNVKNTSELLAIALWKANYEVAELLIRYGAKVDLPIGLQFSKFLSCPPSDIEEIYASKCESDSRFKNLLGDEIQKIRSRKQRSQRSYYRSYASANSSTSGRRYSHTHNTNFDYTGFFAGFFNSQHFPGIHTPRGPTTRYGFSSNYNTSCQDLAKNFSTAASNPDLEFFRRKIVINKCSEKEFLGVESTDEKSVLKAFKKLSRKLHPDRNPSQEDAPLASALFCCLGAAKDFYTK